MDKSQYLIKMRPESHIVILGGSGGIGSQTALAIAANSGNDMIVTIGHGRNQTAAEVLKAQLESWGVKAFTAKIDRSSLASMEEVAELIVNRAGREITGVVDAIGISPNIPFKDLKLEDFDQVMNVNVRGCIASTKVLAERMKAKNIDGVFSIVTSTNGDNSFSAQSLAYDMSKRSLDNLVVSLAEEYAPFGIRLIGVAPGWVADPDQSEGMNSTLPVGMIERETGLIYLGRQAQAIEVGKFIAATMMDSHAYATGVTYKVDGGYPRRNPVRKD